MGLMMADYHLRPWHLSHVERRKNVLYVYGYGGSHLSSSVDKLRRELPEDKFKVMCWDYPQRDCKAAVRFLEHKIRQLYTFRPRRFLYELFWILKGGFV